MLLVLIMDLLMRNLEVHRSIAEFFIFLFLWEEYFKLYIYVKKRSSKLNLFVTQGGKYIYRKREGLSIDHDHVTGRGYI